MRLSSSERQEQIVQAALALLAEHSVDRLTTRRVAARVGISQPALFRHFSSREDILLAVLDHVRRSLGEVASQILEAGSPPRETIRDLAAALLGYVDANPGMPRLLFYDVATSPGEGEDSRLRPRLRQLLDMQHALLGEIMTQAQAAGALPEGVRPGEAAQLLVQLLQARILARHLDRASRPTGTEQERDLDQLLRFFWSGLDGLVEPGALQGPGCRTPKPPGATGIPIVEAGTEALLAFDTREDLHQGLDPFESIRTRLARLAPAGLLLLDVPFLPEPLLALLRSEGWRCEVEAQEDNHQIRILGQESQDILDLRDLEPPEPMVRILEDSMSLQGSRILLARLPRVPRLLLPRLAERGLHATWVETRGEEVYLAIRSGQPGDAPGEPEEGAE